MAESSAYLRDPWRYLPGAKLRRFAPKVALLGVVVAIGFVVGSSQDEETLSQQPGIERLKPLDDDDAVFLAPAGEVTPSFCDQTAQLPESDGHVSQRLIAQLGNRTIVECVISPTQQAESP